MDDDMNGRDDDAQPVAGKAICLSSGRGGCDAQMTTLASRLARRTIVDNGFDHQDAEIIMCTGPERVMEAVGLARRRGAIAVGMGDPGMSSPLLDLVVTTPQFPLVRGGNVVRLDLAINPHSFAPSTSPGGAADALRTMAHPVGLLLVGGPAGPWKLDRGDLYAAITSMSSRCASIVVLTSARTPDTLKVALRLRAQSDMLVDRVDGNEIRFADAVETADEIMVTGDSVSMISEAIQSGTPTGVVQLPAEDDAVNAYLIARTHGPEMTMPGDLTAFWEHVARSGPLSIPTVRPHHDPLRSAVAAVRAKMVGIPPWVR